MHIDPSQSQPTETSETNSGPWYRELTRYHWFVFIVAALGWLFDTMDQQLFTLTRSVAMRELVVRPDDDDATRKARVAKFGGYATSVFLIGWATGGLVFGFMGDRYGRAKTMLLTILIYSIFTGLSALSQNFWQFAVLRFFTGLGVGGEFAVGISLLAEVMPDRARPHAIGWLQSLSAFGNITAAVLSILTSNWRILFMIGTGPALLSLLIRRRLKEPERWQALAVSEGVSRQLGSYRELFGDPRWRHHALAGLGLAFAGVVGLWGIGFFSFDLLRLVLEPMYQARGLEPAEISRKLALWVGVQSILQNAGGFVGIQAFMRLTERTSRRFAFLVSFIVAMLSTAFTFWFLGKIAGEYDIFWMIPLMGACQLALFGGYAIYFPELFPTRLRSTGTSFCYNVGRFVAAIGPFTLGILVGSVFKDYPDPMRYGGVTMCIFFLVGLVALPFAPETKGKPLPE